jgi:hypothetical protein
MYPVIGYAAGVAIGCGARLVNHPPSPHNGGGTPENNPFANGQPSNPSLILVHPFRRAIDRNRSNGAFTMDLFAEARRRAAQAPVDMKWHPVTSAYEI